MTVLTRARARRGRPGHRRGRGARGDGDHIDRILGQWRRERPDWDVAPLAVAGRLLHLARHLERRIEARLETIGLGIEAFDVLATLRRSGPPFRLTPSQLFRSLMLSSSAMTNRVDRLEAAGLVLRTPDPTDRRSVLVGLTPAGRELIENAFVSHLENLDRIARSLEPAERAALQRLLRKLLTAFEAGVDAAGRAKA